MKALRITGWILLVLGLVAVVFGGLDVTTSRRAVRVGELEVSAERKRTIPPAVGIVMSVAGLLIVFGSSKRRS